MTESHSVKSPVKKERQTGLWKQGKRMTKKDRKVVFRISSLPETAALSCVKHEERLSLLRSERLQGKPKGLGTGSASPDHWASDVLGHSFQEDENGGLMPANCCSHF